MNLGLAGRSSFGDSMDWQWHSSQSPLAGLFASSVPLQWRAEAAQDAGSFQDAAGATAPGQPAPTKLRFLRPEVEAFQTCVDLAALIAPSSEPEAYETQLNRQPECMLMFGAEVRAEVPHDADPVPGKAT